MRTRRSPRRRQRGMTLLEIMIVITIIGLVTVAIGSAIMPMFARGKIKAAKQQASKLVEAAQTYSTDHQDEDDPYPPSLDTLLNPPDGTPYVKKASIRDPWGQKFLYFHPARKGNGDFEMVSKGPDKQIDTKDDIVVGN